MIRCFVIGPIGNRLAEVGSEGRRIYEEALAVFEDVIRPACNANNLDPIRADGIAVPGEITEQIFRHLYEDEVVIADLSGANANVMYELGLRHTRDLLTVQIGEYGQLPFDVTSVRTIQFSRSERGLIEARDRLQRALEVGLADGGDPVLATQVWNRVPPLPADVDGPEGDEGTDSAVEVDDADGYVERIAQIEDSFPEMTRILEDISDVMTRMGNDATEFTSEFEQSNLNETSTKAKLSVIARYGHVLQGPADELSDLIDSYEELMKNMDAVVRGTIDDLANNPLLKGAETEEFLDSILGVAAESRDAMESFAFFGDQVFALGGMSRVLRRPATQIRDSVRKMSAATSLMDEWQALALKARAQRSE